MKRTAIVAAVTVVAVALVVLMVSVVSAAPSAPAQKATFTKSASDGTPKVGDIFTFTLFFAPTTELTQNVDIMITDYNPAPAYLSIIPGSVGGGAEYSPTLDAIVWDGWLVVGSSGLYIPYQVEVTGIPTTSLSSGYVITNTATMVDQGTSEVLATAEASIQIMPRQILLPLVMRNY
jgi:hypothetical protein